MIHKNIVRIAVIVGLVLLVPLILTLVSSMTGGGWNWGPLDFVFAFTLLFSAGLAYELIAKRTSKTINRIIIGGIIALVVFLIWIELAVDAISQLVQFLFSS